jgi:hypothetical protein
MAGTSAIDIIIPFAPKHSLGVDWLFIGFGADVDIGRYDMLGKVR